MPIVGPTQAAALATLQRNARAAVTAKWRAMDKELTPEERAQAMVEQEEAAAAALLTFLAANVAVTITFTPEAAAAGPYPVTGGGTGTIG